MTRGSICLLYICIALFLAVGVLQYARHLCSIDFEGYIYLLYICIVFYLAVGVAVCKASMLKWTGGLHLAVTLLVYNASMLTLSSSGSICLLCIGNLCSHLVSGCPSAYARHIYCNCTGGSRSSWWV